MRRRPAAERRPGDDRCDVLRVAHRRGVARFAGGLRPVAIGLYPLAAVVPSGTVGSVVQADCRSRLRENLQSAMKTQVTPHRLLPGTPAAVDHKIAVGNPSRKFSDSSWPGNGIGAAASRARGTQRRGCEPRETYRDGCVSRLSAPAW